MKILDLTRKQWLWLGAIVTLIGVVTGEGPAFIAFIGGLLIGWALKPPEKVYVEVEYKDKKIPTIKRELKPEEVEKK